MIKTKLGYIEKAKLMLHFELGVLFKLFMAGAVLVGMFTPVFYEETTMRVAVASCGGLIMILIGLPIACSTRLQKMEQEYGEGVADAYIAWFRTAGKDDYIDPAILADKLNGVGQDDSDEEDADDGDDDVPTETGEAIDVKAASAEADPVDGEAPEEAAVKADASQEKTAQGAD